MSLPTSADGSPIGCYGCHRRGRDREDCATNCEDAQRHLCRWHEGKRVGCEDPMWHPAMCRCGPRPDGTIGPWQPAQEQQT